MASPGKPQPAAASGPGSPAKIYHHKRAAPTAHALLVLGTAFTLVVGGTYAPANLNVIFMASVAVYAGCWRSVKVEPPTESMTKGDAMRFPLVGSCVLFGLFLAFKFLPKEMVNMLLTIYIGVLAVLVLTVAALPFVEDFFPEKLQATMITLPKIRIPHVIDTVAEPISLNVPTLAMGAVSVGFCAWYALKKHWVANNVIGLALSLEGIEHLSLGSTQVGIILLVGLFFYDIFWVFCTPVMVSVAKNFDAPIKLLFPRAIDALTGKTPFSMLGLGDIVIPGIFVALMLRMDVQRNFARSYFTVAFGGYVLGLAATIVVMNVFNAAQPALLYIVPSVLGSVGAYAWTKGEFLQVFHYTEVPATEEHTEPATTAPEDTKKLK